MTHLRVLTPHLWLANAVADTIEAARTDTDTAACTNGAGAGDRVEIRIVPTTLLTLRHRADLPRQELTRLLGLLDPFQLTTEPTLPPGDAADAEILLGDEVPLEKTKVELWVDSPGLLQTAAPQLAGLGLRVVPHPELDEQAATLRFGGARPFVRQLLQWFAKCHGTPIPVDQVRHSGSLDETIHLHLRDPACADTPPQGRWPIHVATDDFELAAPIVHRLVESGFLVEQPTLLTGDASRHRLAFGPFRGASSTLRRWLGDAVSHGLSAAGVDADRYPLTAEAGHERATLLLPLRAAVERRLRPYAGPFPERFQVILRARRPEDGQALVEPLRAIGFAKVHLVPFAGRWLGPLIEWNAMTGHEGLQQRLREALALVSSRSEGGESEATTFAEVVGDDDDARVVVTLPGDEDDVRLLAASLQKEIACANIQVVLPDREYADLVRATLGRAGFPAVELQPHVGDPRVPTVWYGGAAPGVAVALARALEPFLDQAPRIERAWSGGDQDVTLRGLSPRLLRQVRVAGKARATSRGGFGSGESGAATDEREPEAGLRPFVQREPDGQVRIGTQRLPRRADARSPSRLPHTPPLEAFRSFCLDDATAATLQHLAESVALREPCLLEGDTSTSKSSSVTYLAALLGQPLLRLSLHGQTDTGELVGRFQPETSDAPHDHDHDHDHEHEREHGGGTGTSTRPSTRQGASSPRRLWRWNDGAVLHAIRHGYWLLLDEINLAEPAVVERLNALLERMPTFVVSEHDGAAFGPGATPIHPDFRVFATMNPAEHVGRSPLSRALRDRFTGYLRVPGPGESETFAMLAALVLGQGPTVRVDGVVYREPARAPTHPALGALSRSPVETEALLRQLARFHGAAEYGLGGVFEAGDSDRPVITRRTLLATLDFVEHAVSSAPGDDTSAPADRASQALERALRRYYVGRGTTVEQTIALEALLVANGLSSISMTQLAPGEGGGGVDAGAASGAPSEAEDDDDDDSGDLAAMLDQIDVEIALEAWRSERE